MPGLETPVEFAEKIAQCLALKREQVDDLFLIDEDKEGYFVATLYPKQFLDKNQFKLVCGLVKDLGGEGYLQGAKSWKIAGPMAKKSPTTVSTAVPTTVQTASPKALVKISQSSELHIGALGGSDSALTLRAPDGKPVSVETVKPQDMTVGKAQELLDTPAGREVLADAVKEAIAKGEVPQTDEEPLFADHIKTAEGEHEPLEPSEKTGVGSSRPLHDGEHRHKLEGTQVGKFHCGECNQDFLIDHISADKHRLKKVEGVPE